MAMNDIMWSQLGEHIVSLYKEDFDEEEARIEWRWQLNRTPARGVVVSTGYGTSVYIAPMSGELEGYLQVDIRYEDPQPGDITSMMIFGSACADETERAWPFHVGAIAETITDQLR